MESSILNKEDQEMVYENQWVNEIQKSCFLEAANIEIGDLLRIITSDIEPKISDKQNKVNK